MRFFIVGVDRRSVLDEFDAGDVLSAVSAPEWEHAPIGALLVHLATGDIVAKRRVAARELLVRGAA